MAEKQIEKQNDAHSLTNEARETLWRLGAKGITDSVTEPIAAALFASMEHSTSPLTMEQIYALLRSDIGKAFVAGVLGGANKVMPVPGLSKEHSDKLGHHLREHAMFLGGGFIMERVMAPFYEAVGKFLASSVGASATAPSTLPKTLEQAMRMERETDEERVAEKVERAKS